MTRINGMAALQKELDWLSGGYEVDMSSELNDLAYDGAEKMEETMARDTGWLKASVFQIDGFMFSSFGTTGTDYAAYNDGYAPITTRAYTTTPFFKPTIDYVESKIADTISKVISARSV